MIVKKGMTLPDNLLITSVLVCGSTFFTTMTNNSCFLILLGL